MREQTYTIDYKGKGVPAVVSEPPSNVAHGYTMVLTHGAGGDMYTSQLHDVSNVLTAAGWSVLRFTCRGHINHRVAVYCTVIGWLAKKFEGEIKGVFMGGRSMGARAAMIASAQLEPHCTDLVLGIVCLAYPLHPPKQHTTLRTEPLAQLRLPALFISGTKDEFATQHLMTSHVEQLCGELAAIHWIEGANHSHKVRGKADGVVTTDMCSIITNWCQSLIDKHASVTDVEHSSALQCDARICSNDTDKRDRSTRDKSLSKIIKTTKKPTVTTMCKRELNGVKSGKVTKSKHRKRSSTK